MKKISKLLLLLSQDVVNAFLCLRRQGVLIMALSLPPFTYVLFGTFNLYFSKSRNFLPFIFVTQSKFILIKWSLYAPHSSIERFHVFYFGICCFSADVDKLKKLVLHNPYVLTLPEVEGVKDEVIPKNVQQFWVRNSIAFSGGYEKRLLHLSFFFWCDLCIFFVNYFAPLFILLLGD